MNLLADESVDALVVRSLRDAGHDVESVAEMAPGITDEEVLRRSAESKRLLLTADKDFGEMVYRLGQVHSGIVLLRLAGLPSQDRAVAVLEVVDKYAAQLSGSVTVVTPQSVRIRRSAIGD